MSDRTFNRLAVTLAVVAWIVAFAAMQQGQHFSGVGLLVSILPVTLILWPGVIIVFFAIAAVIGHVLDWWEERRGTR
jgi:hypothetical protein